MEKMFKKSGNLSKPRNSHCILIKMYRVELQFFDLDLVPAPLQTISSAVKNV